MTSKSRVLTFSIVIAVFATALIFFYWEKLGTPAALAALGALAIGAFLGFRRVREDGENGEVRQYGRLEAALPKRWQNWMIGEKGSGPHKD